MAEREQALTRGAKHPDQGKGYLRSQQKHLPKKSPISLLSYNERPVGSLCDRARKLPEGVLATPSHCQRAKNLRKCGLSRQEQPTTSRKSKSSKPAGSCSDDRPSECRTGQSLLHGCGARERLPTHVEASDELQWLTECIPVTDLPKSLKCVNTATLVPPITPQSLSELEVAAIISNPKLRHDVNFDRDLHFRPNLDGSRGKHGLKTTEDYWAAIAVELELYEKLLQASDIDHWKGSDCWSSLFEASQQRVPLMFDTIRAILKTLVPEGDQARVEEQFDVPVVMLQIRRGVFDLVSLSRWLALLLKAHCAPMRDGMIDRMVEQIEQAVTTSSPAAVVDGLNQLFGILETMKLVGSAQIPLPNILETDLTVVGHCKSSN